MKASSELNQVLLLVFYLRNLENIYSLESQYHSHQKHNEDNMALVHPKKKWICSYSSYRVKGCYVVYNDWENVCKMTTFIWRWRCANIDPPYYLLSGIGFKIL